MDPLPETFQLERYFDKYNYTAKYLLSCSEIQPLSVKEILHIADDECKALWDNLTLQYTQTRGHHLLRKEVAPLHGVEPDDVLVAAPQEAIYIAMQCLARYIPRDPSEPLHVIVTYPAYQSLYESLRALGCEVDFWNVKNTNGQWDLNVDELQSLLKKNTKLVIVNFPHNPTGFIPSTDQWNQLITICQQKDIYMFSDEMYRLSNNDGSVPLQSVCALYDKGITLFGMSKTFGMPGARIGWLALRDKELMGMMCRFKDYISACPPAPSEILSIIILRNKDDIISKSLKVIKSNLQLLETFFAKYEEIFRWFPPKASTIGLVQLKGRALMLGEGGASGFCDALVKQKQVLLLPTSAYKYSDEYVRLGFGRNNLQECLQVLEEFLHEYVLKK